MPKITVTYDLPDERPEFEEACDAGNFRSIIRDLDNWLRSEIKHQDKDEFQPVRDKLYQLIDEYLTTEV